MKKLFTLVCVVVMGISAMYAQEIGFDVDNATNYHLIYFDANSEIEFDITDKIVQDLRPNEVVGRNLWLWEGSAYEAADATGKGSLGQIGGYLALYVNGGTWSGLGFNLADNATYDIDYTSITDDYRFHMAAKSTYSRAHGIELFGQKEAKAAFSIGVGTFDALPNITPDFKTDGTWNIIDIPVSRLKELGFVNRAPFKGNYFVSLSGAGPNDLALDAIFFYSLGGANGIADVNNKLTVLVTNQIVEVLNATAPIEIYDLSGVLVKESIEPIFGVEELNKGIYIVKSGGAVEKICIR